MFVQSETIQCALLIRIEAEQQQQQRKYNKLEDKQQFFNYIT